MKKVNANEMRNISGGMWQCTKCGKKFWLYLLAVQHCNCEAHYNKKGAAVKFCLW